MKKLFQFLQLLICMSFMISLIYKVSAWIPNGVFGENPGWWIGQIAMMTITYGLALSFITFIKKYLVFKTEM